MRLNSTQNRIIRLLFLKGSLSRKALAQELSLSKAALTFATKEMFEAGVLLSVGEKEGEGKVGRREEMLKLNPSHGHLLGLDIRRHNFYFSLTDFAGGNPRFAVAKTELEATHVLENYQKKGPIAAFSLLMRGEANEESLKRRFPLLWASLAKLGCPWAIENNVAALARIYAFYNEGKENFLLVKYGPGLGSAIYVNGDLLGSSSELGHAYVGEKPLEEQISFSGLFGEEMEEKEGAEALLGDEALLSSAMEKLSYGLYNATELLHLEKIVLSGLLLSHEKPRKMLLENLKAIEGQAALPEIVQYPSYAEINEIKGSIRAFLLSAPSE